jgi:glucokinase
VTEHRIGIDFGGTRIKLALVDDGEVVRKASIETPHGAAPAAIFDAIAAQVRALDPSPSRLGMAIPGEVDRDGRCIRLPNVPGFEGVAMAAELSRRVNAAVVVENDATTAAYAEALFGHGKEYPSFLTVTLGTGVGGGLVIERGLVRGAHGFGAEIGHVTVDTSTAAVPCACGNRGCLEAYAGTVGLLAVFRASGGAATEIAEVAASARRGEAAGLAAFASLSDSLAVALNSIQNVLDLDAIVFSGGVSKSFDLVEPRLRAGLRAKRFAPILGEVPLLTSELGEHAGVVGAAHLPELSKLARTR